MANQPFSVSVKYVGGLSGAQISDLSPFGSPNVSGPDSISNATFAPISLTSIILDPDTYSVFDGVSLRPRKGVNEVVSSYDDIQAFSINKKLRDLIITSESSTFSLIKLLVDDITSPDFTSLSVYKPLVDNTPALDEYALALIKPLDDNANSNDTLQYLDFTKRHNDDVLYSDTINQISVIKSLEDYANPIDAVGIPDGSTFQLIKTLRNTSIVYDAISTIQLHAYLQPDLAYSDSFTALSLFAPKDDSLTTSDYHALNAIKVNSDDITSSDSYALDVVLPKDDNVLSSEHSYVNVIKPFTDISDVNDVNVLHPLLGKQETSTASDSISQFTIDKSLQDYANPVDAVGIPDGSTYQLVKSIRNSVSEITDSVFVRSLFVKFLDSAQSSFDESLVFDVLKSNADAQTTIDTIQQFVTNKVLKDYANPIDYVGIPDGSTFQLNKTIVNTVNVSESIFVRRHIVRYLDDAIDSSLFTETIVFDIINAPHDSVGTSTSYPTFNLHAQLKDYANPVDAVGIPDGSTFALYKTLVNTVSNISDNFSKIVDYNREFNNSASVYDDDIIYTAILGKNDSATILEHTVFNVTNVKSDQTSVSEYKILSAIKALSDSTSTSSNITSIRSNKPLSDAVQSADNKVWSFNKSFNLDTYSVSDNFTKVVNYIRHNDESISTSELITQKTFDKTVKDTQDSIDTITQFTSHKLLQDYANPLDYVGIPDNSTFQLAKTLANFVANITDSLSYRLTWVRHYADTQTAIEKITFNLHAHLNDSVSITDDITAFSREIVSDNNDNTSTFDVSQYSFNKSINNVVSQLDSTKFISNVVRHDNVTSIFDKAVSHAKPAKHDTVSSSDHKSFNANIVLSDGFNEQILQPLTVDNDFEVYTSPDIDIMVGFGLFDFENGLSQYSTIKDAITHTSFNKRLTDYANPIDYISIPDGSTFRLNKTIANFANVLDSLSLRSISFKHYADTVGTSEVLSRRVNKTRQDTVVPYDVLTRRATFNRTLSDVVYTSDLTNTILRPASVQQETDNTSVTDSLTHTMLFRRYANDTVNATTNGVLYIQNYAAEAYFAEDYTGTSYTFV